MISLVGHVFPLRAREGGVLEATGHAEAVVDLPVLPVSVRSGSWPTS